MVTVRLHAALRSCLPHQSGVLRVSAAEGLTVRKVLQDLGVSCGAVGLVLVNGKMASLDRRLLPGDCLELYPIFGGG
ncbi:MoaD/ThiS family protein [Desulfovirgula thermocuniculi]|uniref:MoaD/ThiS family protein n=1 Tax=Desulfovirgula thermocuniculi TaxID=348842 RepID=UPI00048A1379|nr:MoaD/ThiS family protein [Desulfovirgula thermocuniculi]